MFFARTKAVEIAIIYMVLFLCVSVSGVRSATTSQTLTAEVVHFVPQVWPAGSPDSKIKPCLGTTLLSHYLITSESCISALQRKINTVPVEIADNSGAVIGIITSGKEGSDYRVSTYNSALILPFTSYLNRFKVESLSLYQQDVIGLDLTSTTATLYSSQNRNIGRQWVKLENLTRREHSFGYFLVAPEPFPQGTPVSDSNGNIVCIVSGNDYCASLGSLELFSASVEKQDEAERIKRDSGREMLDCTVNPDFGCSHYQEIGCSILSGSGTCTNTRTQHPCNVQFFKKGDGAPYIAFAGYVGTCGDSDGCGFITCHDSDNSSTVDCIGHWGWSSEVFQVGAVKPSGCMDFHKVIKTGTVIGLVIGVAGFAIAVPTLVIIVSLAIIYRMNTRYYGGYQRM